MSGENRILILDGNWLCPYMVGITCGHDDAPPELGCLPGRFPKGCPLKPVPPPVHHHFLEKAYQELDDADDECTVEHLLAHLDKAEEYLLRAAPWLERKMLEGNK
jgi:hypothetical protein